MKRKLIIVPLYNVYYTVESDYSIINAIGVEHV